ncbi:hypothetical protein TNCV_4133221 [Trichonephila clavipes]|uniref:Uncharacterized protein n=1 Tax=Trichonephila clavipes TaxID=2585209 RepID=A0A8X6SAM5_TRICX|nr:hypothetical protein TNCV_4133221 [Trichonephila clavipes]
MYSTRTTSVPLYVTRRPPKSVLFARYPGRWIPLKVGQVAPFKDVEVTQKLIRVYDYIRNYDFKKRING